MQGWINEKVQECISEEMGKFMDRFIHWWMIWNEGTYCSKVWLCASWKCKVVVYSSFDLSVIIVHKCHIVMNELMNEPMNEWVAMWMSEHDLWTKKHEWMYKWLNTEMNKWRAEWMNRLIQDKDRNYFRF